MGYAGAWETYATNVLTPTNTAAGILVNSASSTITNLWSDYLNASTTVVTSLQVGSDDAITDITGSGLSITAGVLSAVGGGAGAWQLHPNMGLFPRIPNFEV